MARLKPGAYRNTRAAVVMCAALLAAPALGASAQMPLPGEFQDVALLGEIVTDDDVEAFGFTSAQGAFIACSAKPGRSWALFTPPLLPQARPFLGAVHAAAATRYQLRRYDARRPMHGVCPPPGHKAILGDVLPGGTS